MDISGTSILLIIVMIVALFGMIYCNKKQEKLPAAKIIAVVLMVVIIGCGVTLVMNMSGMGSRDSLIANESKFFSSQGFVTGDYIKTTLKGGPVVIVANEGYEKNKRMQAFLESVKQGLGNDNVTFATIDLPELSDKEKEMAPPISERMKATDFDNLTNSHPEAKVFISLIGLPRDAPSMKILAADKNKAQKLILVGYSEMKGLGEAIKAGAISAVVTVKPKAKFNEDPAPSDPKEAFAVRYVLIDEKNADEYKKQLP